MTKEKVSFCCTHCNYKSVKWIGCCPTCSEWNSFIEEQPRQQVFGTSIKSSGKPAKLFHISEISAAIQTRMCANIKEWDRVMGGGILPGSFLILTGDPGIGKSTLLLQVADMIAQSGKKVLYFSSEESLPQVKTRADRLHVSSDNLFFSDQAYLDSIIETGIAEKPNLVIVDSIQNCHLALGSTSIPGTVGQLREAGFHLMRFAKEQNIATIVTGHITKEGYIAGPKILEHIVDGVFYLQGEDRWHMRVLRSVKNRFGTINEVGFFEMQESGLQQVVDINKHLLTDSSSAPGSALVCSVEGSRPLLLELQALCVATKFGVPQRIVTGIDHKRISLIAAILEKYLRIKFSAQDIFFKVSGGLTVKESASDLGIALALLSSYFQKVLPNKSIAIGELNLAGQIKPTNHIKMRIKEAEKFGLEKVFVSYKQKTEAKCQLIGFNNVYDLLNLFPEELG